MIVEMTLLSFVLSCQPRKCSGQGDQILHLSSNCPILAPSARRFLVPHTMVADSLEVALAKDLATIPDVRHVLAEHVDGNLLVWIAIDNPEYELRTQIYQKQLELMDGFPEVNFDFNLIPAMGRSAAGLATGARAIYSRV